MTGYVMTKNDIINISTHMPLARHDLLFKPIQIICLISTHMPLARHDIIL